MSLQLTRLSLRATAGSGLIGHGSGSSIFRLSIRALSTTKIKQNGSDRIRNIGIMAHIDAGKTTTTERMLYYSGFINRVGEVHTGDTVMDWMDQERERGITITAAAITLPWNKHQINLIDTPGHVDFTMEVERSLRVTDGSVLIIDGSAGVQAQTLTVWRQAKRNASCRIAYINKLDKPNADINKTLVSIRQRLNVKPLLTQMPLGSGRELFGLVDLTDMTAYTWADSSQQGKLYRHLDQETLKSSMFHAWKEANELRENLIESCCDFDNELAEAVILAEGYDQVSVTELKAGLRRISLNPDSGALVTCLGSSYKNIGVQPLMDAIIAYLPSPADKSYPFLKYYDGFCGSVFKIIHHPQKGVLSFIRIYSGSLSSNSSLYNINKGQTEKFVKLMVAFADNFREVDEITAGNIAVVSGLRQSMTGDTVVGSQAAAKAALKLQQSEGEDNSGALLASPYIPEPVFFCSIEPPSMAAQKQFELALECISREDPSVRVRIDQETGQTVLGGMGELHLEILLHRIKTEWKVEAEIGKLQVAYREVASEEASIEETFERKLADRSHSLQLSLTLKPSPGVGVSEVAWSKVGEAVDSWTRLKPQTRRIIENGIKTGLESGPLLGYPVVDCCVTINRLQIGRGTSNPMLSAGAAFITKKLLRSMELSLAEPVMSLEIICEEDVVQPVLQDLNRRRGEVDYAQDRSQSAEDTGFCTVKGTAPLAELRGYSSELRTLSSGKANLSMELSHYQMMSDYDQDQAIEEVTGFAPS